MVRISDILKKTGQKKAESERPPSEAPALPPRPAPETKAQPDPVTFKEKPVSEEKQGPPPEKGVTIFETVMAKNKLLNEEECLELYQETVSLVKEIYDKARAGKETIEADLEHVIVLVEKIADQQCLNNDNILNPMISSQSDDFLFQHAVNVAIVSMDVGLGLEYDKTALAELGFIAILHDIGMVKFKDLYRLPRRLNQTEYDQIRDHTKIGAGMLEQFKNTHQRLIAVIAQSHERVDGSGYPLGLKEENIDEYARIIGAVDMYEALVHSRPYRAEKTPYEALRVMLTNKNGFEKRIMKILIERMASPFPLGSNIKLNSGEKGRVIKRNLGYPLRPVVEITHDAKDEKLGKPRTIDLSKSPTIHIKSSLEIEHV